MDLKKCCCCIDLPLGCKIIAVLGFFADAGWFGGISGAGVNQYVLISANVIGMLGCICLLYGAFKSHKTAVALYLIADATKNVLWLVFAIWSFVLAGRGSTNTLDVGNGTISIGIGYSLFIAIGVIIVLNACIWTYFLLIVFSFFKKIGGKVDAPRV